MDQYSETLFDEASERIYTKLVDKKLNEVEQTVLDIVEELDGRGPSGTPFDEWTIDRLLSAQGRLSLLRVNLGIAAARARAKSNHINRWHLFQNSKEWKPTKAKLEKELDKILKADIESVLVEAFWETTQQEVFKQEIADRLQAVYDSTNQVLTAIKFMIAEKTDERAKTRFHDNAGERTLPVSN